MFVIIFNQLLKMLFIIILAVICFKKGIVSQEGNRCLSNLLMMLVSPCLILTTYQTDYDPSIAKKLLIAFIAALAAHFIGILVANLFVPKSDADYAVTRFGAIYSNCGFLGIPLANSILGGEGVFYISAYMAIFNLVIWTHGLGLFRGKIELKNIKEGVLSPMFISTIVAIILYFIQFKIPEQLLDSMTYIANTNTPLAMMVAGFSVAQADFKKILSNTRLYLVSFLKLFVMPLALLIFLWAFKIDYNVAYAILIAAACPTATMLTMMCIRYDRNYTYSSEIFSFTTVLSIVTIPLVVYIAEFLI